jgi:hypothetical protein
MALWGNQDALASAPKWIARIDTFDGSNSSVVNTSANTIYLAGSTNFATGDALVYTNGGGTSITGLTSGNTYYCRRVDSFNIELFDTQAHAIATGSNTGLITLSAVGAGTTHTLQRDPSVANAFGRSGKVTFLVSKEESQSFENRALGIDGPGWWSYLSYTAADGSVRHKAERVVAMNSEVTEASDNINVSNDPLVSGEITIITQPSSLSITHPATATFTVAASITGIGTLGYQWYRQANGTGSFAAISGATSASYTTPATTVAANNGDVYYCVVSATDYTVQQSSSATLTVA